MSVFGKIKDAFVSSDAKDEAPASRALPSLDEIHDRIIKAKLNFRQTVAEAEVASKRSQAIYAKLWDVTPNERAQLRKQKAEQDSIVKRKMIQAQSFARSLATLQDVEVVMQIDQAFSQCGLVDEKTVGVMSLESIQKSLEEASLVVTKTMESVEKLGMTISVPESHSVQLSEVDRESDRLWAEFDRESDPVKKEEIKRKLQEKEATPQLAMA